MTVHPASNAAPERCDNHPDRPIVARYGTDTVDGGGRPTFLVRKRLCAECDREWRAKFVIIERT